MVRVGAREVEVCMTLSASPWCKGQFVESLQCQR